MTSSISYILRKTCNLLFPLKYPSKSNFLVFEFSPYNHQLKKKKGDFLISQELSQYREHIGEPLEEQIPEL
jgi:hypothetical protein